MEKFCVILDPKDKVDQWQKLHSLMSQSGYTDNTATWLLKGKNKLHHVGINAVDQVICGYWCTPVPGEDTMSFQEFHTWYYKRNPSEYVTDEGAPLYGHFVIRLDKNNLDQFNIVSNLLDQMGYKPDEPWNTDRLKLDNFTHVRVDAVEGGKYALFNHNAGHYKCPAHRRMDFKLFVDYVQTLGFRCKNPEHIHHVTPTKDSEDTIPLQIID